MIGKSVTVEGEEGVVLGQVVDVEELKHVFEADRPEEEVVRRHHLQET